MFPRKFSNLETRAYHGERRLYHCEPCAFWFSSIWKLRSHKVAKSLIQKRQILPNRSIAQINKQDEQTSYLSSCWRRRCPPTDHFQLQLDPGTVMLHIAEDTFHDLLEDILHIRCLDDQQYKLMKLPPDGFMYYRASRRRIRANIWDRREVNRWIHGEERSVAESIDMTTKFRIGMHIFCILCLAP